MVEKNSHFKFELGPSEKPMQFNLLWSYPLCLGNTWKIWAGKMDKQLFIVQPQFIAHIKLKISSVWKSCFTLVTIFFFFCHYTYLYGNPCKFIVKILCHTPLCAYGISISWYVKILSHTLDICLATLQFACTYGASSHYHLEILLHNTCSSVFINT